jgi:hypothetical protein
MFFRVSLKKLAVKFLRLVTQLKTPQTIEEKYVKFNLLYKKD